MGATIAAALAAAQAAGVERIDAQRLLAHLLDRPRAWLIAHDDHPLPAAVAAEWQTGIDRLADDVPLAHLLGEHQFRGLMLRVTADVLVPRADTECLVEWAIELLEQRPRSDAVDLGTGSGAIALAIATERPDAQVLATDSSPAALTVARHNAGALGLGNVVFAAGDWYAAAGGAEFDLIVANPPYLAESELATADRELAFEPRTALVAGPDGLDAIRRIVTGAPAHLAAGGWMVLEHGATQGETTRTLCAAAGLIAVTTARDLAGLPRITEGRHPASTRS